MSGFARAIGVAGVAGVAVVATLAACSPAADEACGETVVCEPGARCFPEGCDTARRCARGPEAALYGRAAARDGGCVARDDASCRGARVTCAGFGQCSAPPEGWAPAGGCPERSRRDGDFLASRLPGCTTDGTCVALNDEDCRASRVCALEGRCTARDGVCVAVEDEDCAGTELCAELGRCTLTAAGCRAVTPADCEASTACHGWGDCGVARGACVSCARSEGCALEGLCDLVDTTCRATQPRHCRATRACKTEGRCRQHAGVCVR